MVSSYGLYASSALAGQSLMRNILGMVFPLFTQQMYQNLTYKWANTLFGCIALLMLPIPFVRLSRLLSISTDADKIFQKNQVLFYYGPRIRMMSKFSRKALEAQA